MDIYAILFLSLSEEEKKKLLGVNVSMADLLTYSFENNMRKITEEMTPFKDTDIKLLEEKR